MRIRAGNDGYIKSCGGFMQIDTSTVVSVSWFGLQSRRRALPKIFYADVRAVDPSIQLIYSFDDVVVHEDVFVRWMDSLVSGMFCRDDMVKFGFCLLENGFNRHQVEQYADILLGSLKTLYGLEWTPSLDSAWIGLVGKASFYIQGADRRRHSV